MGKKAAGIISLLLCFVFFTAPVTQAAELPVSEVPGDSTQVTSSVSGEEIVADEITQEPDTAQTGGTGRQETGTEEQESETSVLPQAMAVAEKLYGWQEIDGVLYYYDNTGAVCTGLFTVSGASYFADEQGAVRKNGLFWDWPSGGLRYADPITGKLQKGWLKLWGNDYFANNSYLIRYNGWHWADGATRYFSSNGSSPSGITAINGKTYLLAKGASVGYGWYGLNDALYYFGTDGTAKTGLFTVSGVGYFADEQGAVRKNGLFWDWPSGGLRYADPTTGKLQKGWLKLWGNDYFADNNYLIRYNGWHWADGKTRYFSSNGSCPSGITAINGKTYLLAKGASVGYGWYGLNDALYYFGTDGAAKTGLFTVSGAGYFADEQGVVRKNGLFWDWPSGGLRYADPATGKLQKGWLKLWGNDYFADNNYLIRYNGWHWADGKTRYFSSNGSCPSGITAINGKTYLLDRGASIGYGWHNASGTLYYFGTDGAAKTGLFTVSGASYFANEQGVLRKGLFWDWPAGGMRYANPLTHQLEKGWKTLGENQYYFNENYVSVNGKQVIDGRQYIFENHILVQDNQNIQLTVKFNGVVTTGSAEDILSRVVAGEIGGLANDEAYKAQAVAAYTYILYQQQNGVPIPAMVTGTPNARIRNAVKSVIGQAVLYNGKPILAVYTASNGGATYSSETVGWSKKEYLLDGIPSVYDSLSSNFKTSVTVTVPQMQAALNRIYNADGTTPIDFSGDPSQWVSATYNAYGYADRMQINIKRISQGVSRVYAPRANYFKENSYLGIRSVCFTVSYNPVARQWTFTSYGYGHSVGLSQWGAYYYATKEGRDYRWILAHYYPGTVIGYV